jgi:hypothetical protein
MTDQTAIKAGREAWQRLRGAGSTTWEDWVSVAQALALGRELAMRAARSNTPHGKRYQAALVLWLAEAGLSEITRQERQSCWRLTQNLQAVTDWRNQLDASKRRKINHPDSAFWLWKRSSGSKRRAVAVEPASEIRKATYGKAINWPREEHIRRAAMALGETYSRDLYAMASAALKAALRNEDDVLELLKPAAAATPAPALELLHA